MDDDLILQRETEGGSCAACGCGLSQWEHGIPIGWAIAGVHGHPELLEPMLRRRCERCGARYGWDVLVAAGRDSDPETERNLQAAVEEMLDQLLNAESTPADALAEIARRLDLGWIMVREGSEIDRQLRRPPLGPRSTGRRGPDRLPK